MLELIEKEDVQSSPNSVEREKKTTVNNVFQNINSGLKIAFVNKIKKEKMNIKESWKKENSSKSSSSYYEESSHSSEKAPYSAWI